MSRIEDVVQRLKEAGISVEDYEGEQNNEKITTGKIVIINDLPFFLLDNVCEDVLSSQEKMSIFIEQLKYLKNKSC